MERFPRVTLLFPTAFSSSSTPIPNPCNLASSGSMRICVPRVPLISTRATWGTCSTLRAITSLAKRLNSRNFSTELPGMVRFMKNAGMSVALAFITLGLSTSLGSDESTLSIFSFTSMKLRSVSDLCENSIKMLPLPFTASQRISSSEGICINCILSGFITCSFISRADVPLAATCTVICGMSTLGIREMGSLPMATIPTMSIAIMVIVTAMGRSTSLLSIINSD